MRILIIEDDPAGARAIERRLVKDGLDVEHVSDAAGAMARLRSSVYDLIILDVTLPDADGFAVCRHVRAIGVMVGDDLEPPSPGD